MKLKSFCTTKEMVSKLKRPSDKGPITTIYREFKKLNSQKSMTQ
jgi:hypothetical protein